MPPTTNDSCIIWCDDDQRSRKALCFVRLDPYYESQVSAAETFFSRALPCGEILSFELGPIAGLGQLACWNDMAQARTDSYLSKLEQNGIGAVTLSEIRDNLNIETSIKEFNRQLESKPYGESERAMITLAHEIAKSAHVRGSYARPQDTEGLFHIPYVQHPRNIAIKAMELGAFPTVVAASLLHDVLEDTTYPEDRLNKMFPANVMQMVQAVTRRDQSHLEFVRGIVEKGGDTAMMKALDRYDNLLRGFAIPDPVYFARVLEECREGYDKIFEGDPRLNVLMESYTRLKEELERYRKRLC